jgi:hypothetical protein
MGGEEILHRPQMNEKDRKKKVFFKHASIYKSHVIVKAYQSGGRKIIKK